MTTSFKRRLMALVSLCCAACADGSETSAGDTSLGQDASTAPTQPLDAGSLADTGSSSALDATPVGAAQAVDATSDGSPSVHEDTQVDASWADASSGAGGVSMKSSRYSQIGEELFMGVTPANVVSENNSEY